MHDCPLIEIQWTCGSLDEAREIAQLLVQERLVACAQIIPRIESIFIWKGKVDTQQETKVLFKTLDEKFDAIKEMITKHAKYEVPEILKIPIQESNQPYLEWVRTCLTKNRDDLP